MLLPGLSSGRSFAANLLRAIVDRIEPASDGAEILQRVPQHQLQEIRRAGSAWLPAHYGMDLYRAINQVRGEEGLRRFSHDFTRSAVELPLFMPFVRVAVSFFGRGPDTLLRLLPRANLASSHHPALCLLAPLATRYAPSSLLSSPGAVLVVGGAVGNVEAVESFSHRFVSFEGAW